MKLSGLDNRGRAGQLLAEIDAARRRGVQVDCDAYPYACAANPLRNLLPLWVQEGGVQTMLGRLRDPTVRRRVGREIDERGLTSFGRIASWDAVSVSISRTRSGDAGRNIAELARSADVEPIDLICDLLEADSGATYVVVCSIDEADVQALLRWPAVLVGSDGRASPRTASPARAGRIRGSRGRSRESSATTRGISACYRSPRPCTR
jgi:N-acyl-D-aspartate/D-glutamate deacylase